MSGSAAGSVPDAAPGVEGHPVDSGQPRPGRGGDRIDRGRGTRGAGSCAAHGRGARRSGDAAAGTRRRIAGRRSRRLAGCGVPAVAVRVGPGLRLDGPCRPTGPVVATRAADHHDRADDRGGDHDLPADPGAEGADDPRRGDDPEHDRDQLRRARPAVPEQRLDRRCRVALGRDQQPPQQVDEDAEATEHGQHRKRDAPQHRIGVRRAGERAADAGDVSIVYRPDQAVPGGKARGAGRRRWRRTIGRPRRDEPGARARCGRRPRRRTTGRSRRRPRRTRRRRTRRPPRWRSPPVALVPAASLALAPAGSERLLGAGRLRAGAARVDRIRAAESRGRAARRLAGVGGRLHGAGGAVMNAGVGGRMSAPSASRRTSSECGNRARRVVGPSSADRGRADAVLGA